MPRPPTAALPAALLLVAVAAAADPTPDDALRRAEALLARDEPRAAASAIEAALPSSSADRRSALLGALKRSYDAAIRQAESSGRAREAAEFRELRAILDRTPRPVPAPVPERPAPPAPVAPLPLPEVAESSTPAVSETPPAREEDVKNPTPLPAPSPSPHGATETEGTPAGREKTGPEVAPILAPHPESAEDRAAAELDAADAAFTEKKYPEAGRRYAALARAGRLPAERREAWAYCRWHDLVARINAGPRSAAEWARLRAEVEEVRRLVPHHWFGEYLRNLVADRAGQARPGDPRRVVVRGSMPEEARPTARPPAPRRAAQARRPSAPETIGRPGAADGAWQVWDTPNFRILHTDEALARRVAAAAEATRDAQVRFWTGSAPRGAWSPLCEILLYPTAAQFAAQTGQPADSPGFSASGLEAGRVTARRIHLRADHPKVEPAVLPHEVTHVVLAELFPHQQIPRWADEGMAVLAEPEAEQRLRAADLAAPLADGALFRLEDLMTMDYPGGKHWSLYYAQSISLTRFLVAQGTPAQFVQFVRSSQQLGVEPALRHAYRIEGYADLHRRWLAQARAELLPVASAGRDAAATTVRR